MVADRQIYYMDRLSPLLGKNQNSSEKKNFNNVLQTDVSFKAHIIILICQQQYLKPGSTVFLKGLRFMKLNL